MGEDKVIMKYGSWDKYKALKTKSDNTLYFLDNHLLFKGDELLYNVQTIDSYPDEPTNEMRLNFYINLAKGEIRYVTEDRKYINLSQLLILDINLTVSNLKAFVESLEIQEVTMPTLEVSGLTLVWTPSNITSSILVVTKKKTK